MLVGDNKCRPFSTLQMASPGWCPGRRSRVPACLEMCNIGASSRDMPAAVCCWLMVTDRAAETPVPPGSLTWARPGCETLLAVLRSSLCLHSVSKHCSPSCAKGDSRKRKLLWYHLRYQPHKHSFPQAPPPFLLAGIHSLQG